MTRKKSNGGDVGAQASNAKATADVAPTTSTGGRPTKRTDALVKAILEQLAQGTPLAAICRQDGMPHPSTFRDWLHADKDLGAKVDAARGDGEEAILADCLEIADDGTNDYMETKDGPRFDAENVQRSKLRIHTRLQLLEKWNPKKWGPKVDHNHSGHVTLEQLVTGEGK